MNIYQLCRYSCPTAVCYAELFFEVANRVFFAFKLVLPGKREVRARSSRNDLATLGEVPRPVSRFSIVAVASISTSSFFDFFLEKNVYQTEPLLDQLSVFLTTQLKNELIRNSRECDSRKAET